MFGFFKPKTYPTLTPQMIQPPGNTPSATEAKRLYRDYMSAIGFYGKDVVELHSRYFAEELKDHEASLREFASDCKQDVKDAKLNVKECKAEVKTAPTPKERAWADEAITRAEAALQEQEASLEKALQELEAFKQDKRPFLISYINEEVHGDGQGQSS